MWDERTVGAGAAVAFQSVSHRYGGVTTLSGVDLVVPEGSIYALLGPNGAGKTTLLRIAAGLLRPGAGRAFVLGREVSTLGDEERAAIGYVAEGQRLPGWMTLGALEAYLAPLYPTWDAGLAGDLRRRFRLDAGRRIRTLSRGEHMKAAVLCALAPRPRLLLMDEPFTGMDALVKDDLVRGLLELAGDGTWSVLVASHDIGELESLADRIGFLDQGRLRLSVSADLLRERARWVEVVSPNGSLPATPSLPDDCWGVERSPPRMTFVSLGDAGPVEEAELRRRFPGAARIDLRAPSLREIFVALARGRRPTGRAEEVR